MGNKDLPERDPLKRHVTKDTHTEESLSPMAPPEAYSPPSVENVPIEDMHAVLRKLIDDHEKIQEALNAFEETLIAIQTGGITKDTDQNLRRFFHFFDHTFVPHDQEEEKLVFPLLAKRLIAHGEHSKGEETTTAVDVMEDDHIKAVQLAAVVFNFLGLCVRLPDAPSRMIVLDAALEQGKTLVEILRLHIFRENNIVFPLAHKYIQRDEFDQMEQKGERRVKN